MERQCDATQYPSVCKQINELSFVEKTQLEPLL
jgi:hypothetical protein